MILGLYLNTEKQSNLVYVYVSGTGSGIICGQTLIARIRAIFISRFQFFLFYIVFHYTCCRASLVATSYQCNSAKESASAHLCYTNEHTNFFGWGRRCRQSGQREKKGNVRADYSIYTIQVAGKVFRMAGLGIRSQKTSKSLEKKLLFSPCFLQFSLFFPILCPSANRPCRSLLQERRK